MDMISFSELVFMQMNSNAKSSPENTRGLVRSQSESSLSSQAWNATSLLAQWSSSSSSSQGSTPSLSEKAPETAGAPVISDPQTLKNVSPPNEQSEPPIRRVGRAASFDSASESLLPKKSILKGSFESRQRLLELQSTTSSSSMSLISSDSSEKLALNDTPRRKTKFSSRCAVILIPSRKEYVDAGIDLWVSKDEQRVAQLEVAEEVRDILDSNPALSIRMATSFLYQPSVDEEIREADSGDPSPCDGDLKRFSQDSLCDSYDGTSGSGKIRSPSLLGCHSYYSDTKQRLNIAIADVSRSGFESTKKSIKSVLQPYQRWVISCKHCRDDVETLELLFKSSSVVSQIDVVVIDESICELIQDCHDSDIKTFIQDIKSASDNAVVGLILNELNTSLKDMSKKGGIDFIWKKPINTWIPMLPIILCAHQAKSLNSSLKTAKSPYGSPSGKAKAKDSF